jgi:hypothetical protein
LAGLLSEYFAGFVCRRLFRLVCFQHELSDGPRQRQKLAHRPRDLPTVFHSGRVFETLLPPARSICSDVLYANWHLARYALYDPQIHENGKVPNLIAAPPPLVASLSDKNNTGFFSSSFVASPVMAAPIEVSPPVVTWEAFSGRPRFHMAAVGPLLLGDGLWIPNPGLGRPTRP